MDKLLIEGGRPLEGSVRISGAKNAALPAMAAALLTPCRVELDNIPRVRDIITMGRLLAHMSATVETPCKAMCLSRLSAMEGSVEQGIRTSGNLRHPTARRAGCYAR